MESLEEEEHPKGLLLAGEGLRLGDGRDSCELKRGSWNQFSVGRARFSRVRCHRVRIWVLLLSFSKNGTWGQGGNL
jgi:hypothetical protein